MKILSAKMATRTPPKIVRISLTPPKVPNRSRKVNISLP
jgi:hypothetical protein